MAGGPQLPGISSGSFSVLDVSDSTSPVLLDGISHIGGSRSNITVEGSHVFVTLEAKYSGGPVTGGLTILETVAPALCPADLSGDGAVGPVDLAMLLAAWGPCDGDCPADINDDGEVGPADLAMLLASWGACK